MKKPKLETISQLARRHEIDRASVRRYLALADLKPLKKDGQSGFYDRRQADIAIEAAMERRGTSPELIALRLEKAREQIRGLRIANDHREKLVISGEAIIAMMGRVAGAVRILLYQKLENELPCETVGLAPEAIRVKMRPLKAEVLEHFRQALEEMRTA